MGRAIVGGNRSNNYARVRAQRNKNTNRIMAISDRSVTSPVAPG